MVVSEGGVALGLALTPMQESVLAKIKSEPGDHACGVDA